MKVTILPSRAVGTVSAPPSKSAAHRALICAALARGESTIRNLAFSQDIEATADCLRALGAVIEPSGDTARVRGVGTGEGKAVLNCRESGSTLRFLLPVALAKGGEYTFLGSGRLMERPMRVYETICREAGIKYEATGEKITVSGRLRGGAYTIPGDVSSQFVSGLLFALAVTDEGGTLSVLPPFESRPYVDLTLDAMRRAGVAVEETTANTFTVPGGRTFRAADVTVEGDYSNAAFLDALGALGGDVTVTGLDPDSLQGDRIYRTYFEKLEENGAVLPLEDVPDLAPILFALAAAKNGARFTGTRRLAMKESDRGAAMAEELLKFGVSVRLEENEAEVPCVQLHPPSEVLSGHNDHRIVMSLAVLSTVTGGTIAGAEAVAKSMPNFFDILESLGVKVVRDETV